MGKKCLSHRLIKNMAFYFGVIALFLVFISLNTDVFAEGLDAPEAGVTPLVANGYPILIEDGTVENTTTIKCDTDRDGTYEKVLFKNYSTAITIYGGSATNDTVTSSSIVMNGGEVGTIFGGGAAYNKNITSVTKSAKITINGGKVSNVCGGGQINSSKGKAEVSVEKSEIVINGGSISDISFGGAIGHGAYGTTTVNESKLTINNGNVLSISRVLDEDTENATARAADIYFEINGGSVCQIKNSANSNYNVPRPKNKNGQNLYKVTICFYKDGNRQGNIPVTGIQIKGKEDIILKDVITGKAGDIFLWLPSGVCLTGAYNDEIGFVCRSQEAEAIGTSDTSRSLYNSVNVPKATSKSLVYNGKKQSGIINVLDYTSLPYDISGDSLYQKNAGSYKTIFTLNNKYKWSDGTTEKKEVEWKILKANQQVPTGITATDETGFQKNDGTISGLEETMEITKNFVSWTSLKGKIIDGKLSGLEPGTYYIRYVETQNYKASEYIKIRINAVPETHTLTIMDFEGKQILDTFTVEKIGDKDGYFRIVLPDKYNKYAFFKKAKATLVDDLYYVSINNYKDQLIYLTDDLVLYALEPEVTDYLINTDFSDGKTKTYVLDQTFNREYFKADDEDVIIKSYLSQMIFSKLYNGDFIDKKNLSREEIDEFFESNTFFITPCAVNDTRLTDTELSVTNASFSEAKVIPHISIQKEKDSVLQLKVKIIEINGQIAYQFTLSAVDNVKDTKKTIFELGTFPADEILTLIVNDPLKNLIYKSCIFNAVLNQEENTTEDENKPAKEQSENPDNNSSEDTTQNINQNPSDNSKENSDGKDKTSETANNSSKNDDITKIISYAENVPVSKKSKIIKKTNTDKKDVAGSTQRYLQLRQAKITKNSIKIKWKKIKKADGYLIYGSKCGSKMKLIKKIKKSSTTSLSIKKLKKNTYYKYLVVAYKNTVSGPKVITTSKSVHIATSGGKKGNPASIKKLKKKYTVKKGKKITLKPKYSSKKKVNTHIAKFRYESLNKKIATVDKKGRIKGIKKGTTSILVYTQNGICKKVKVKVK